MSLRILRYLLPLSLLALSIAPAQAVDSGAVVPRLLANVNAIKPGQKFLVGVLFSVRPPWHIYWKNPGEAGLPTRVQINHAPAFEAGELQWPVPRAFKQPGNLDGYGYEEEVLLFQEVTPPSVLEYGAPVSIKAEVRWLGCLDICVPGRASLELTLPVAAEASSAQDEIFERWTRTVPVPADQKLPFIQTVKGELPQTDGAETEWQVIYEWASAPHSVSWFPLPAGPYAVSTARVETRDSATHVSFKVRRQGAEAAAGLPFKCVLAYTLDKQPPQAVELPLQPRAP